MLLSTVVVFTFLLLNSLSLAEKCPKIVTQKDFDITKVSLFFFINKFNYFLFSMLVYGMKFIEVILFLKSDLNVSMQHIQQIQMDQ